MIRDGLRTRSLEWAVSRRLATQRLTSPALPSAADAVRTLLAVQAQDAPLATWSLGLRSRRDTHGAVRAEQDAGTFVRTHVLRPTWHYVAAEDLRWLLGLTSATVERGMASRHRQLELDDRTIAASIDAVAQLLSGGHALTRKQLGPLLADRGLPGPGERLAHVLLLAELRGVVCSGPHDGREHTYALLEERLAPDPDPPAERDESLVRLVTRFFHGHGPAGVADLVRWAAVTTREVRRGLDAAGDRLAAAVVEGEEQWFDPAAPPRASRGSRHRGLLLPTFDEVVLSYVRTPFPRVEEHVRGDRRLSPAEVGGGAVVVDGRDVGTWRRIVSPTAVRVRVHVSPAVRDATLEPIHGAAERLASFVGLPLSFDV
ncbi:conserved hypothetical protein [Nostocoides japonicum T1-X7]|uniref:Winged helix DNA-binding domain-containing protein n=1 Tax=Nostocoides japonicum T1-X7 TaxID=1194083 RepID=A0A077LTV9_9MICO|nr:winged helix DNA-binding domain-containing protein [Tetrasphaera japonica]CCH76821.1 conserved hypothetical protein [Tetrasphaera japonica T1-X7]